MVVYFVGKYLYTDYSLDTRRSKGSKGESVKHAGGKTSELLCKYTVGPFKSFVMNNKAFRNLFCNPQKSFHTSTTRIIEAVNHSSNPTIAFTQKFYI